MMPVSRHVPNFTPQRAASFKGVLGKMLLPRVGSRQVAEVFVVHGKQTKSCENHDGL